MIQAYARRVGEQQANALTDLSQWSQRVAEGQVYAKQQARGSYLTDNGKILGELEDLTGQAGTFTAARVGDLRDAGP